MDQVQPADIEDWIDELDILCRERRCRGPKFVKPFHFATLAHTLRRDHATQLNLPEKISRYAHTMNLWDAVDIPSPHGPFERNPAGRYHPLELLEDEAMVEPTAKALLALFTPVCSDPKTLDAVYVMLRELLGNCHAHSEASDGLFGVVCAQVWSVGRRAQIAIADSGIGIRRSLMGNPLLLDRLKTENSCQMATAYGITSKPGKGHSGYGLAVARGLMEQNHGVLYVRSGNEAFHLSGARTSASNTRSRWNGTLLVIEWDLDRPMDITKVYKAFPLPEGMDDDDFDF
ncbi:ATP-binding protein [Massilia sp. DD77]|uniref:ATP-binding protein n=1 Tax=Massilia sp. DD77 TaxID=3109349 RepID=UPI002FFE6FFC